MMLIISRNIIYIQIIIYWINESSLSILNFPIFRNSFPASTFGTCTFISICGKFENEKEEISNSKGLIVSSLEIFPV